MNIRAPAIGSRNQRCPPRHLRSITWTSWVRVSMTPTSTTPLTDDCRDPEGIDVENRRTGKASRAGGSRDFFTAEPSLTAAAAAGPVRSSRHVRSAFLDDGRAEVRRGHRNSAGCTWPEQADAGTHVGVTVIRTEVAVKAPGELPSRT